MSRVSAPAYKSAASVTIDVIQTGGQGRWYVHFGAPLAWQRAT